MPLRILKIIFNAVIFVKHLSKPIRSTIEKIYVKEYVYMWEREREWVCVNLFRTARGKFLFKRDMMCKYQYFHMKKSQHDSLFILYMNYLSIYNFVIIWIKRYLLLPRKYRTFFLCLLPSKVNQHTVWTIIGKVLY